MDIEKWNRRWRIDSSSSKEVAVRRKIKIIEYEIVDHLPDFPWEIEKSCFAGHGGVREYCVSQ
jgi:hypothetical protein